MNSRQRRRARRWIYYWNRHDCLGRSLNRKDAEPAERAYYHDEIKGLHKGDRLGDCPACADVKRLCPTVVKIGDKWFSRPTTISLREKAGAA